MFNCMKIVLGADPFAYELKRSVAKRLQERGIEIVDTDGFAEEPYYDIAEKSARIVACGEADGAVLFCGTGAGMSIVANKVAGIRAVCVESVFAASKAKAINGANVISMGAMIVGESMACEMVDAWLDTKFTQGFPGLEDFLAQAKDKVSQIDSKLRA